MPEVPEISIIVPLYNEEKSFSFLIDRLNKVLDKVPFQTEVVLINDGSKDSTPLLMNNLALSDGRYQSIFLSRNYGHQLAVSAGLAHARASDAVFIIDGDLQDPPELIEDFYKKFNEGFDVVYGIRKKRKESFVKKNAYWIYYRFLKSIANIDLPLDSGDFSMISRRVTDNLNNMPEHSRFIRGMRSWIGFKQVGLEYERDSRAAGQANYTFKKLFELAFNGIFNFSEVPVKIITRLGLITILGSFSFFIYVIVQKVMFHNVPHGFTSLYLAISIFSGVQLISLGLIGEYVLRIFDQVRNRPLFIIDKIIKNKELK